MTGTEELDAFLEKHGMAETTSRKKRAPREPVEKATFRCSCGTESTDLGVVKAHAWKGHLFHRVNQKPWSES